MAIDQITSDGNSEVEVDDDIANCRMFDSLVDVSKDEKQLMHPWTSFVRKQRVWLMVTFPGRVRLSLNSVGWTWSIHLLSFASVFKK